MTKDNSDENPTESTNKPDPFYQGPFRYVLIIFCLIQFVIVFGANILEIISIIESNGVSKNLQAPTFGMLLFHSGISLCCISVSATLIIVLFNGEKSGQKPKTEIACEIACILLYAGIALGVLGALMWALMAMVLSG